MNQLPIFSSYEPTSSIQASELNQLTSVKLGYFICLNTGNPSDRESRARLMKKHFTGMKVTPHFANHCHPPFHMLALSALRQIKCQRIRMYTNRNWVSLIRGKVKVKRSNKQCRIALRWSHFLSEVSFPKDYRKGILTNKQGNQQAANIHQKRGIGRTFSLNSCPVTCSTKLVKAPSPTLRLEFFTINGHVGRNQCCI